MDEGSLAWQSKWVAAAFLAGLLLWETLAPFFPFFRGHGRDRVVHGLKNLMLGLINALMLTFLFVGLWAAVTAWTEAHDFGLIHQLNAPAWVEALLAVLIFDFMTYWWHRFNHQMPFLWRFHRVHHSDPQMDVTTANRFHAGEIALSALYRLPWLLLSGASLWHLALYEAILFPVVQFHHANVGLPPRVERLLRWILVTPGMHKVHHSRIQLETDSNYTSLFSLWDRVFGSFRSRRDLEKIRLGLEGYDTSGRQSLSGMLREPLSSRRSEGQEGS